MRNKLKSFLLLTLLSLSLAACVGPPKDDHCIPYDGTHNSAANPSTSPGPGENGSFAQKMDAALKDGKIISSIVRDIKAELIGTDGSYTGAQGIFEGFVQSPQYQTAIGAAFSLFVIIYGMSVAVGMVQVSLGDAAIRVAKIGFISVVAMNWDVFYQDIGSFFINGTDEIINYFLQNFADLYSNGATGGAGSGTTTGDGGIAGQIFSGYDDLIARIFSFQTFAFISALFHAGPYAPIYGAFLIMTLWWLIQAVMKVVQVYIFSLFAKALLFAIAPVFLAFILFERTKPMFDAWLNQLVSFSLQPILITAYIGLFSKLITPFFDEFAGYKMCWNRIGNTADGDWGWQFVNKNSTSNQPVDFGPTSTPPIQLQAVFLFMFFAWLFKTALSMTDAMSVSIANAMPSNTLSSIEGLRSFSSGIGVGNRNQGAYGDIATRGVQSIQKVTGTN